MFGVVCLVAALALLGSAAEPRVFPVYVSGRAEALPLTLSPSESYEDAVNRFMIQVRPGKCLVCVKMGVRGDSHSGVLASGCGFGDASLHVICVR